MEEKESELIILWVLTGGAVAIMLLRLGLKRYRQNGLELGEYFTIMSIISILLRGAVIHVALVWGTNSISKAALEKITLTPEYIYRHEIGSKLTMVNRAFYTVYTWLQKCVVMCVLQRLLRGLKSDKIVKFYWATLAVTFIVAFIVTFTECRPFGRYWQVTPYPGTCSKGIIQLEVFSSLSMATDVMLIALPLPQVIKLKRPLLERLRLLALFTVGLAIVAVSLTRLLLNVVLFQRSGPSHTIANIEIFFAAFVANAPTIYGMLSIKAQQRSTPRGHSYLPDSWSASKSARADGNYTGRSRGIELNRRPSAIIQGHATRGQDSDEEMMIEGGITKTTHVSVSSDNND
ncbi:uncharacterized protein BP5553_06605 [Venustampulla echinocandica]|uniref:Rhodopsin domain-containing protein n=1 Tax=Venustampulla echinocandica TaxID=2656787 RepID=A0A370TKE6_9HELO|nr:uncharacterized protein BP5553_06605 [Venustampulla echinocandica]RDL35993.1 hypothetical protein BP5553_06605 [Venustampulla echinocandica]